MKKLAVILSVILAFSMVFSMVAFASSEDSLTTAGQVNIRKYPSVDTEIIGVLEEGVEINPLNFIHTVDGRTWVQVVWNGQDGYISDRYLEYPADVCPDEYEVLNVSVPMRTTGNVYLRKEPSIDAAAYKYTLGNNVLVDVWTFYTAEDGRVWAEIEWEIDDDIVVGYISTKYLEFVDDWPKLGRNMVVTGGRVNVHDNAWIDSEDIGTIYEGDIVEVNFYIPTADGRIWASCNMNGEYIGFVSTMYLSVSE